MHDGWYYELEDLDIKSAPKPYSYMLATNNRALRFLFYIRQIIDTSKSKDGFKSFALFVF